MAAVAAAAVAAAAGCGGSTSGSGGGDAASLVPASAPVFVSVDTDLKSDQWKTVQTLLDRFPGKAQLLTQLRTSFEKDSNGVTWPDVKAALGPEVDVAVLDLSKTPTVVGLLQPGDTGKFDELLKKSNQDPNGSKLFATDYQGWKVVSDSQANLQTFKQQADTGDKLADSGAYKDATGKLADSALAKVFVDGTKLTAALKQQVQSLNGVTQSNGKLDWVSADLAAQDDGLKLDAYTKNEGAGAKTPAPYTAKFPNVVPAGVLVYLSFNGAGYGKQLQQSMKGLNAVPQAGQFLGLVKQLGPLFAHENALYVRPGAGIPEITLLAQPDSPQQGIAAIDKLVATLAQSAGGALKAKAVTVGTVHAKELNLGRFSVYYGAVGGKVVVTDAQQAFQDLQAGGQKLANDPTFKEAQSAAGMPGQTNGFLYLNLKDSIPLIESLAQLGGSQVPADVTANLKPLRTMVAWVRSSGGEGQASLFLEVK